MDIFTMLQNATIIDLQTDEVLGQSVGFQVENGRMRIRVVLFDDDEDEDPDDGTKKDIPEDDTSNMMPEIHILARSEKMRMKDG